MRLLLTIILSISMVGFSTAKSISYHHYKDSETNRYHSNRYEIEMFKAAIHSLSWHKYWYGTFYDEANFQKKVHHWSTVYYSTRPIFIDCSPIEQNDEYYTENYLNLLIKGTKCELHIKGYPEAIGHFGIGGLESKPRAYLDLISNTKNGRMFALSKWDTLVTSKMVIPPLYDISKLWPSMEENENNKVVVEAIKRSVKGYIKLRNKIDHTNLTYSSLTVRVAQYGEQDPFILVYFLNQDKTLTMDYMSEHLLSKTDFVPDLSGGEPYWGPIIEMEMTRKELKAHQLKMVQILMHLKEKVMAHSFQIIFQ